MRVNLDRFAQPMEWERRPYQRRCAACGREIHAGYVELRWPHVECCDYVCLAQWIAEHSDELAKKWGESA